MSFLDTDMIQNDSVLCVRDNRLITVVNFSFQFEIDNYFCFRGSRKDVNNYAYI